MTRSTNRRPAPRTRGPAATTTRRLDFPETGRATVTIGGHQLVLSNLGKVLYPDCGFTKGDVIDYYLRVAEWMLPHTRGYPVTLKRYPNGVAAPFFYEKRCPPHPEWVRTALVPVKTGRIDYCVIDNPATLVWLANLAALELHLHLARGDAPDRPTMLVFDLDPGAPATLADCARLALELRALLLELGLESLVKTSGSKGLHLYVPLHTPATFDGTKAFARSIAIGLERRFPERVTSLMSRELRTGKVFVDWSQNDRVKTTAAVYTLRARGRPTVSCPVTWKEIAACARSGDPDRLDFTAGEVLERLRDHGDLFAPLLALRQELPTLQPA